MILKIGDRKIDLYNQVDVTLNYDSVGSTFRFWLYFDPYNDIHKQLLKPFSYAPVTIEHNGELLITGILLVNNMGSGPVDEPVTVSGYSKTGVLEDCPIPVSIYPLQSNKLSVKQIAEKCAAPFGLKVIVDPTVTAKANQVLAASTASDSQSIKAYLSEIAGQKHIIVSHDEFGNLLLTESQANKAPIFDFKIGEMPALRMDAVYDGQAMHNEITLQKQASKKQKGNAGQSSIKNPYCQVFRPTVDRQTSGENVDTSNAVRNTLSEELKTGVNLKITVNTWTLNNKIIRPNNIITVTNPYLQIYNKTKFFIYSVDFSGDNNAETAVLNCCLPEVFTSTAPKNIFE